MVKKSGASEAFRPDWSWNVVATVSADKEHAPSSTDSSLVGWPYYAEAMPHIGQALCQKTSSIVPRWCIAADRPYIVSFYEIREPMCGWCPIYFPHSQKNSFFALLTEILWNTAAKIFLKPENKGKWCVSFLWFDTSLNILHYQEKQRAPEQMLVCCSKFGKLQTMLLLPTLLAILQLCTSISQQDLNKQKWCFKNHNDDMK